MTKEQYILDLISQGRSNEEIETLVNIMFPEVDAAPAATTSVSPQQALDRLVAAIKKVKETSGGSWKDITSTYQSRDWNANDISKKIRITSLFGAMTMEINGNTSNVNSFTATYSLMNKLFLGSVNLRTYVFRFDDKKLYATEIDFNKTDKNCSVFPDDVIAITKFEIYE